VTFVQIISDLLDNSKPEMQSAVFLLTGKVEEGVSPFVPFHAVTSRYSGNLFVSYYQSVGCRDSNMCVHIVASSTCFLVFVMINVFQWFCFPPQNTCTKQKPYS